MSGSHPPASGDVNKLKGTIPVNHQFTAALEEAAEKQAEIADTAEKATEAAEKHATGDVQKRKNANSWRERKEAAKRHSCMQSMYATNHDVCVQSMYVSFLVL